MCGCKDRAQRQTINPVGTWSGPPPTSTLGGGSLLALPPSQISAEKLGVGYSSVPLGPSIVSIGAPLTSAPPGTELVTKRHTAYDANGRAYTITRQYFRPVNPVVFRSQATR